MLENLLAVGNDLCVIFFDLLIFTRMTVLRRDTPARKTLMYAGCAAIIAAYFCAVYLGGWPSSTASAVFMTVPSMALFWLLSAYRDSRFFLTFCFVDTVSLIVAFVGRWVGMLAGRWGAVLSLAVTVALYLVIVAVGWTYFKRYAELLEVVKAGWGAMMGAALLIYAALLFQLAYPAPMIERVEYAPGFLLFSIVVLACYNVFVQSILKTKKIDEQYRRLQHENKIYHIAYTDALTGLPNRAAYTEYLQDFRRKGGPVGQVCCLVMDVNSFKSVNDRWGHHMGDRALQQVADVLRRQFGAEGEQAFRVGGDEFFAVVLGAGEDQIERRVARLHEELAAASASLGVPLSMAVGTAFLAPDEGAEALEAAFVRADRRMYAHKQACAAARAEADEAPRAAP